MKKTLFFIGLFSALVLLFPAFTSSQSAHPALQALPHGIQTPLRAQRPRIASSGTDTLVGPPTITGDFINQVLDRSHSPAAGSGQALYDLGVQYTIDPVYALAFFEHESAFGTAGMATVTRSLGNLRCIPDVPCYRGYAQFSSWEQGYTTWYALIRNLYVNQWHLTTVAQIIPVYAPSSDNNDVDAYIRAVQGAVAAWRRGEV